MPWILIGSLVVFVIYLDAKRKKVEDALLLESLERAERNGGVLTGDATEDEDVFADIPTDEPTVRKGGARAPAREKPDPKEITPEFIESYSEDAWEQIRTLEPGLPPWKDLRDFHKRPFKQMAERRARQGRDLYVRDVQLIINSVRAEYAGQGETL